MKPETKSRVARALSILALLALPFVLLRFEAVRNLLLSLIAFMQRAGALGVAAFVGVEIVATMITAPMWLMSGIAGYVYGFPTGFLVALPAITLSTCVCFLGGRGLLRRVLAQRAEQSRFWVAVHRTVGTEGLKITLLLRVTFAAPQNLISYLLSATPLRLRDFALGTFVGLVPATLFHVYLGSIVTTAVALISGEASAPGPFAWIAIAVGLAMTGTALFVTSRLAKRALARALDTPS